MQIFTLKFWCKLTLDPSMSFTRHKAKYSILLFSDQYTKENTFFEFWLLDQNFWIWHQHLRVVHNSCSHKADGMKFAQCEKRIRCEQLRCEFDTAFTTCVIPHSFTPENVAWCERSSKPHWCDQAKKICKCGKKRIDDLIHLNLNRNLILSCVKNDA